MKTTKILSTALLLTIMLALGTNVNAQSARYGGTAYVYAEDRDGNKVVLNAAAEYLYSSESEVKSALLKRLQFGPYEFTSEVRYSIERWDSEKRYQGFASATIEDKNGRRKEIRATIDCDAVGMGYISYFKHAMQNALHRQVAHDSYYITPISYRVNSCN